MLTMCICSCSVSLSSEAHLQARELPFKVSNAGDVPLSCTWNTPSPFSVMPKHIPDLAPGQSVDCAAQFTAADACVYSATATCSLSTGATQPVTLTAIGKFPRLALDQAVVDHAAVTVGGINRRQVQLHNHSEVPTTFAARRSGGADEPVFDVTPTQGTLQPGSSTTLELQFRPKFAGTASRSVWDIATPAATSVQLTQCGTAVGPSVSVSHDTIDFGDVKLGTSVKKVRMLLATSLLIVMHKFLQPHCSASYCQAALITS